MEKIRIDQKEKNGRLHSTALVTDLEGMANALKEGAQVDSIGDNRMNALMIVAREGFPTGVSLLLKNGANPNIKSPDRGDTALIFAVQGGYPECTRVLLQNGADVNLRDNKLVSALSVAIYRRDFKIAEMLVECYGANVNGRGDLAETPLMEVAGLSGDHHDTLGLLIKKGARLNSKNRFGLTALMYAADKGNKLIITKLLESGADVFARDKDGKTAIAWATEAGHMDCVRLLYSSGANARELLDPDSPVDTSSITVQQREFLHEMLKEEDQRRSIERADSIEEILGELKEDLRG
ncbi:MAG: ankyrin repeat domain-containing protein [Candidatus Micrarchaeota archaeon]|nr:ankyrin repeat domain-containing protein [Candidatus Micrarchaeota archaeon]